MAHSTTLRASIESTLQSMRSFERLYLNNSLVRYAQSVADRHDHMRAASERWAEAMQILSVELPDRGWYLTGKEPGKLFFDLASHAKKKKWSQFDDAIMAHLPKFDVQKASAWFRQSKIPEYSIKRFERFLRHHDAENFEEATYLGVPLIDELARYLYNGKAFTTKRATSRRQKDQSKPEIAITTTGSPALKRFCQRFVEKFGALQENPDHRRLDDENYWNRHAIVHGMMRREMNRKDSAKCLMAIAFLLFAMKAADCAEATEASAE